MRIKEKSWDKYGGHVQFRNFFLHEINVHFTYWYLPFAFNWDSYFFSVGFLCVDFYFLKPRKEVDEKVTTVETYQDMILLDVDEHDFVKVKETGKEYMYLNEWIEIA